MSNNHTELSVFDFGKALNFAGANKASLKKSLLIFIKNINGELNKLSSELEQSNTENIAKIVHKINGSSGYLGAQKIKHTCEQISDACRTKNIHSLEQLITDLKQQTDEFLNTIQSRRVLDILE